ncbi:hypothetical protein [Caballeronia sp. INDeC2]|uniref:hypothetical protein n=1 Tax=Caballeronia sp. INDeC2 TaxID=2921747 RepID=UPI002027BE9D|nr:hypothetical protein [Caballeronia sp. INDeC2]
MVTPPEIGPEMKNIATGLSLTAHYRDRERHFTSFFNRLSLLQRETCAVTKSEIAPKKSMWTNVKRGTRRRLKQAIYGPERRKMRVIAACRAPSRKTEALYQVRRINADKSHV